MEFKDITNIAITIVEIAIILLLLVRARRSLEKEEKRMCYVMMVLTAILMAIFMQKITLVVVWR